MPLLALARTIIPCHCSLVFAHSHTMHWSLISLVAPTSTFDSYSNKHFYNIILVLPLPHLLLLPTIVIYLPLLSATDTEQIQDQAKIVVVWKWLSILLKESDLEMILDFVHNNLVLYGGTPPLILVLVWYVHASGLLYIQHTYVPT